MVGHFLLDLSLELQLLGIQFGFIPEYKFSLIFHISLRLNFNKLINITMNFKNIECT